MSDTKIEWNWKAIKFWGFVLLLCVIILLAIGFSSGLTLEPNQCYLANESFFDATTNTSSNVSTNYCCAQQATNYTNNISIVQNLIPGERKTGQNSNCLFDLTCDSCDCGSTSICSRTKTLDPGDTYHLQNDVCDLNFECGTDSTEQQCQANETIIQDVIIDIIKTGDSFSISSSGQNKDYPLNLTSLSDQMTVQVRCPVIVANNETYQSNIDFIENNCRRWIDRFEDRNIVAWELYADLTHQTVAEAFDNTKTIVASQDEFRNQLITCMSNKLDGAVLQKEIEDKARIIKSITADNESLKGDRNGLFIVCGILAVLLLICIAMLIDSGYFEKNEVTY